MRERFASIDSVAQVVRLREGHINQPDTSPGFIAFEIGIVVIEEGKDGGNNDRNPLAIRPCPSFEIDSESLFCIVSMEFSTFWVCTYRQLSCSNSHMS